MPPTAKLPAWMVTRQLLAGSPDVNARFLYHRERLVCRFSRRSEGWNPDDDRALKQLCEYLNSLEDAKGSVD